ncbi:MAG: hypothetical protein M9927_08205 [Anaerolineae bacterium]|nr:hypothetical protein [Anaerolineae bacterium]
MARRRGWGKSCTSEVPCASDAGLDYLSDSLRTKSYAASPRVFTLGWERNEVEETDAMSFDLGRNRMRR